MDHQDHSVDSDRRALLGTLAAVAATSPFAALAQAPKKVVIYTVIPEQEITRRITEEFTRRTGIAVEVLTVPAAGTLAARIRSERANPRADVFVDAPVDFHEALAKEGLLQSYRPASVDDATIKAGFSDPKGYWHGWYALTTCIFWNADRLPKGVKPPHTWDEMLRPELKGQIALANPQTSAIGYVVLATQIFRLGEEKAWGWQRGLNPNVKQYTPSAPMVVTLVEQGEAPIGAFWLSNVLYSRSVRKQPLEFVVPEDNAVNVWAASIVKGGPNPEAARQYVDFLLSEFPQEVNARVGFRNPVNNKVKPPEGAPALSSIKTVRYDVGWAGDNMDRIRKQWTQESGQ
ncbi:extracellular solute-binding protein [Hydrogenophaga laconesensis]|uniref:Iron(III) transport system substrate-binding protein n=1 Tax=Hydrogenophaga laconesensis TaxID=1805971 RepID=A0ABU1V722_9BURK|nr:extracellular solute-binding protein [Hydrogenophaga laconesensis]MDR7093225.1 iron(III) transport system substrate-binding protein [Hydrogenophaga laconesensis]